MNETSAPKAPGQVEKGDVSFGPLGERWAHLCIDMQRLFTDETDWATPWLDRVLPNVVRLVAADPGRTVFTRFVPPRNAGETKGTWRRYWQRWEQLTLDRMAPELVDLVPELAAFAPPARVIDKPGYGPWVPELDGDLGRRGIDTVIISGTETEVCVAAAVLGAVDRGLRTIIASDAICSSADSTHDAMMEIYHGRFGMQVEVAETSDIVRHMGEAVGAGRDAR